MLVMFPPGPTGKALLEGLQGATPRFVRRGDEKDQFFYFVTCRALLFQAPRGAVRNTGLLSFSGSPTGLLSCSGARIEHSPDSGPPIGALASLRRTQGGPVRAGKLPRAPLFPRPYPCRLGARIPRLATVSDKIAQQGLGQGPCSWDSAGKDFSASSQSRCLHAR